MLKAGDKVLLDTTIEDLIKTFGCPWECANAIYFNGQKGHLIVKYVEENEETYGIQIYDAVFDEEERYVSALVTSTKKYDLGKQRKEIENTLNYWWFDESQLRLQDEVAELDIDTFNKLMD